MEYKNNESSRKPSGIVSSSALLPDWYENLKDSISFSCGYIIEEFSDVESWKEKTLSKARSVILGDLYKCNNEFNVTVIAEEDRGTYVCRKILFDTFEYCHISAYLLIPKSALDGKKSPAVVMFHDHGARFDIGKEKMVRPISGSCDSKVVASADEWSKKHFDGIFVGDEYADKGYVVLCADALGWGERACEGWGYDGQQALACNLFNLGTSYASVIAQNDVGSVDFVASLDYVDPSNITALGFSMGAFRSWQTAALSDKVSACVALCWMSCLKSLMSIGNNQLRGQSAFTMCHPGLVKYMDYPDVASLFCPKPFLLIMGEEDKLFPMDGVEEAVSKIQVVYDCYGASDKFAFYAMPGGHNFDLERQNLVWDFLRNKALSK